MIVISAYVLSFAMSSVEIVVNSKAVNPSLFPEITSEDFQNANSCFDSIQADDALDDGSPLTVEDDVYRSLSKFMTATMNIYKAENSAILEFSAPVYESSGRVNLTQAGETYAAFASSRLQSIIKHFEENPVMRH